MVGWVSGSMFSHWSLSFRGQSIRSRDRHWHVNPERLLKQKQTQGLREQAYDCWGEGWGKG